MKCEDCKYWFDADEGDEVAPMNEHFGVCRRYAPTHILAEIDNVDEGNQIAIWPEVTFDDWCGEFQPKESSNDG